MGLTIKTNRPFILNKRPLVNNNYYRGFQLDGFSSFDSSDSSAVTAFQTWYNSNRKSIDPAALVVDGIYGPLTMAAYSSPTGKQYDSANFSMPPVKSAPSIGEQTSSAKKVTVDTSAPTAKKDTQSTGLSSTQKIGIGVGTGILLLVVIILANKKNHPVTVAANNILNKLKK